MRTDVMKLGAHAPAAARGAENFFRKSSPTPLRAPALSGTLCPRSPPTGATPRGGAGAGRRSVFESEKVLKDANRRGLRRSRRKGRGTQTKRFVRRRRPREGPPSSNVYFLRV